MSHFLQDLRYSLRTLLKTPGFAATVVITLALGIGANTAIFSVVYNVVLRPLAYPEPQQLVRIMGELRTLHVSDTGMAALELFDYQGRTDLFSGVAGLYPVNANVTGGDQPERVDVMLASWNYFSILGAKPAMGRLFNQQDEVPGIAEVAVISDGYWRRRMGADPNVLGRKLTVDGDPYVIIGVLPPEFRHPGRTLEADVEIWSPAGYRNLPFPPPTRGRNMLQGAVARLLPGVTLAQAQSRLDAYAEEIHRTYPDDYPAQNGWAPRIVSLQEDVVGNVSGTMLILLGAVGLVLLIACANVANLILTRASERQQEMAIRQALGAGRRRLAQQMLVESGCLALAGGILGLLASSWGMDALVRLAPSRVPRLGDVHLDAAAIAVTLLLTVVTTLLFGLAPALQIERFSSFEALKEGGPGRSSSGGRARVRNGLVMAEVALAVILLAGAGLLLRSFLELQNVDVGFDTSNLLTARVWLPRPNDPAYGVYLKPENRVAFYRESLRRLQSLPGVTNVAVSNQIPLGGYNPPLFIEIDGRETSAKAVRPTLHNFQVSPSYFETLGIPLVRGRLLNQFDLATSEPVAVISESAARTYWKTEDPVGKRIRFSSRSPWITVVGIVGDVRTRQREEQGQPVLYRSLEQASNLALAFLLRTSVPAAGMTENIFREIRAIDPDLPVYSVRSMNELLGLGIAQRLFLMRVVMIFGIAAVGLALLGIYGVISYSVTQRTREIGIRMALGAQPAEVRRMVVGHGMKLTGIGLAIGTIGALGLSRLIQSQLFGVRAADPITLIAVFLLMSSVAAAAAYLPARRAAATDPLIALRHE